MQPRVLIIGVLRVFFLVTFVSLIFPEAAIAQLGERQTEDLKVPGSILGLGISGGATEAQLRARGRS